MLNEHKNDNFASKCDKMRAFVKKWFSKDFYYYCIKRRPLWSDPLKIKDFLGFSNSFLILDIYKCPKTVCESKMGKKV